MGRAYTDCPACGQHTEIIGVVRPLDRPDSLDAAWAEAEAALPEGWVGPEIYAPYRSPRGQWQATAGGGFGLDADGYGPTPAAALRALAAKLREKASDS